MRSLTLMRRMTFAVLILLVAILGALTIALVKQMPKTFRGDGVNITLNGCFRDGKREGDVKGYYYSSDVTVIAQSSKYSDVEGLDKLTKEQYFEMFREAAGVSDLEIVSEDGLDYAVYPDENDKYRFRIYVFRNEDALWAVSFGVKKENYEKYESDVSAWAKTITFE